MIIYGKQVFYYTLQHHASIAQEITLSKDLPKKEFDALLKYQLPIKKIDNKGAQGLAKSGNHQGYFLKVDFTPKTANLSEVKRVIVLDRITDTGNIGGIIRSAYALGFELVIITGINNIKFDTILRSSSGALLDMPIRIDKNSLDTLNELKTNGFSLVGADISGSRVLSKNTEKVALFLGSEGEGLHKKISAKLDEKLTIPMHHGFDSLNVSVAAGILMDRIVNDAK